MVNEQTNDKLNTRPNEAEKEFLTLAYNRFYDIFDEIISDLFWTLDPRYRLSRIKDIFSLYAEIFNFEPIKWEIERIKQIRPLMEGEIGESLFKFVRNVILHFPLFDTWENIWISKSGINWNKSGQSADKFLSKYEGHAEIKYRFWEKDKQLMTYLSINFPKEYSSGEKIFLKDILSEKEGVKFSIILMRKILDSQVVRK